jgi:hypothetical protein
VAQPLDLQQGPRQASDMNSRPSTALFTQADSIIQHAATYVCCMPHVSGSRFPPWQVPPKQVQQLQQHP